MKYRSIVDIIRGRLFLPLRLVAGVVPGEFWLAVNKLRFLDNGVTPTVRTILTDQDLGQPNGVAQLGADGLLPPSVIPSTTGGGGGGSSSGLPVGTFLAWGGDPRAVPSGYLACVGDEVFQADFPRLFSVFGHRYGVPSDFALKFKLPNFVGRTFMGVPDGNDMAAGRVHKIVVRNPGIGFPVSATITTGVYPVGSATVSTPVSVRLVTNAAGGVDRVEILDGGAAAGVVLGANANSMGESNCNLVISPVAGAAQFNYDIVTAPTSSAAYSWGVRLTNKGEGYSSRPSVSITGPSLTGATGIAVMEGSRVREVILTHPGIGDPTGAMVSFSGGGPSTPATGGVVVWNSPISIADVGGEQQHIQQTAEMPSHNHSVWRVDPGAGGPTKLGVDDEDSLSAPSINALTMDATGGGAPMPILPPYVGSLIIVRAE